MPPKDIGALHIQDHPEGVVFKIFVRPKSSKNTVVGLHADALKIKLTAPPVEGAANKMCIKFLAKCMGIPKYSLEIISGHTSRTKHLLLRATEPRASDREKERLKSLIANLLP